MAFKIKDGVRIGTVDVFNNSGTLLVNAPTATKWATPRTITLGGDLSGNVSIDGSQNVTLTATIAADSVALGTDTTGNYASAVTAGTGIVVTGTPGEGTSFAVAHADTSTQASVNNSGNTFIQGITLDDFGHITAITSAAVSIGAGALTLSTSAGSTNTAVTIGTGTGFNANSSAGVTYDIDVGPALTALASTMTGASTGFLKKTGEDTYTLDNSTYLTAEADTLATVTARGNTTATAVTFTNNTASTSTTTGAVVVTGGVGIGGALNVNGASSVSGNLTVGGNLTVNGTTTTVNSTVTTLDDPVLTLGGDTAPATDDNKDRGVEFRWHDGTAAKLGFFGFDDSSGKFTFIPDATNTSEVFSGTKGELDAFIAYSNVTGTPTIGNGAFTVNTGNDLSGGAQLGTANQTGNTSITVSHADIARSDSTSTASPAAGGTFTAVDSVTTNARGHVTGINLKTVTLPPDNNTVTNAFATITVTDTDTGSWSETGSAVADSTTDVLTIVSGAGINVDVDTTNDRLRITNSDRPNNGTFTVSAGTDLTGSGSTSANASSNTTATITHSDIARSDTTSNTNPGAGGSFTAIDSVTSNARGHITAVNLKTVTLPSPGASTDTLQDVTSRGNTTNTGIVLQDSTTSVSLSGAKTTSVATTTATAVDTWAAASYRSAKYLVQITQGSDYQVSEVLVLYNGTTTTMTEYAVLESGSSLATLSSDISAGNARLLVTMGSATAATVRVHKVLMAV